MDNRSHKPILSLADLFELPRYILPIEVSTMKKNGKFYFQAGINNDSWEIPCGEPVILERRLWHLLNNNGVIKRCTTVGNESITNFDPIRNGT